MNYYILKCGSELTGGGPFTLDGSSFMPSKKDTHFPEALVVNVPDENFSDDPVGVSDLTDFIQVNFIRFCVSDKVRKLLAPLRVAPNVRMIETSVRDLHEQEMATFWYVWCPSGSYEDILDLGRANIEYYSGGKAIAKVNEWVLDQQRIPPFDLFGSASYTWIVSDVVKHVFEDNDVTNVSLEPIVNV